MPIFLSGHSSIDEPNGEESTDFKPINPETYNALLREVEAGNITMQEAAELAATECEHIASVKGDRCFMCGALVDAEETPEELWIKAALRHYPPNWAFDATNPELMIANIVQYRAAFGITAATDPRVGGVTDAEIEMARKHGWRYWFDNYQEMVGANVVNIRRSQELEQQLSEVKAHAANLAADLVESAGMLGAEIRRAEKAEAEAAAAHVYAPQPNRAHRTLTTAKSTESGGTAPPRIAKELKWRAAPEPTCESTRLSSGWPRRTPPFTG